MKTKTLNICIRKLKSLINIFTKLQFLVRLSKFKTVPLLITHFYRKNIIKKLSPAAAMFALTYRCQFKCGHCAVANYRGSGELSLAEIEKTLDQLFLLKVPRLYFDGGEPLLREDIFDIIAYSSRKGFVTFLETNGFLLSESKVKSCKDAGLSCVNVSLYGSHANTHDGFTGVKNSFQRILDVLAICYNKKLPCLISIVVTNELIKTGEINKLISLAKERKACAVRLTAPHFVGRWSKSYEPLSEKEKEYVNNISFALFPIFKRANITQCSIGYSAYISPGGEIQPCEFLPYSFGNIKDKPIDDIIWRMRAESMFQDKEKIGCRVDDFCFRQKFILNLPRKALPIKLYS